MFAKAAKLAAINIVLVLLGVGAAELGFGTWFSSDPLDSLGLPRDFQTIVSAASLYPGGKDFVYRRDRWGFRGAVDPAAVTIVTLGGSTTNQLYLPEDQTWQAVLERQLREMGRDDVAVANAGIDGQSSVGHLRALSDWLPHIPDLKPRFILVYAGINDVHITGPWVDNLKQNSWMKKARQHSAVLGMIDKVAGTIKARRARLTHHAVDWDKAEWTDKPNMPDWQSDQIASQPESFGQRVKAMATMIHDQGAIPIFITQARADYRVAGPKVTGMVMADGLNGVDQYRLLERLNQATLQVCKTEGLLCLDLAHEVKFQPGDFYDLLHNTPQGAEKIGRWLAERLAGLV